MAKRQREDGLERTNGRSRQGCRAGLSPEVTPAGVPGKLSPQINSESSRINPDHSGPRPR